MKKIYNFSKMFLPFAVLSIVLMISGVIAVAVRVINFVLDFDPGLLQEIRFAPTAFSISYTGTARVTAELSPSALSLVVTGAGADNTTKTYPFAQYTTVTDLVAAINGTESVSGVTAVAVAQEAVSAAELFVNSAVSTVLTDSPYRFYYADAQSHYTADEVRNALSGIDGVAVKEIGEDSDDAYQIRISATGTEGESKMIQDKVSAALLSAFGAENVAVIKTDFIGAQFSQSLVWQASLLVIATLVLIWIYAAIRFSWDFALGAVLAVIHDALIMVTFIAWTQMEFSTTTLAAILTIVGYSINATVVILDRVRSNMRTLNVSHFTDILNVSLSETLSRTIYTTLTTLVAVLSLYIFTTGSMKDFALALIVGMISGAYSSIYISSAIIALIRRNWKPSDEVKAVPVYQRNSFDTEFSE